MAQRVAQLVDRLVGYHAVVVRTPTPADVNGNVTRFQGFNMMASGMMLDRTAAAGVVVKVVLEGESPLPP